MKNNIEYVTDYHSFDRTRIKESLLNTKRAKSRLKEINSRINYSYNIECKKIIKGEFENEKMYRARYEDEKKKLWQEISGGWSDSIKLYENELKTNEDSFKLSNYLYNKGLKKIKRFDKSYYYNSIRYHAEMEKVFIHMSSSSTEETHFYFKLKGKLPLVIAQEVVEDLRLKNEIKNFYIAGRFKIIATSDDLSENTGTSLEAGQIENFHIYNIRKKEIYPLEIQA